MPKATVEFDREAVTAMLFGAAYKLFWTNEHDIRSPVVVFEYDRNGEVNGANVSVELTPKEKK